MPQHIVEFLMDEFKKQAQQDAAQQVVAGIDAHVDMSLENFVRFSKEYLTMHNQPMGVTYAYSGLGLHLQHGQIVMCSSGNNDLHMRDEGVPITNVNNNTSRDIVGTPGIPVTSAK